MPQNTKPLNSTKCKTIQMRQEATTNSLIMYSYTIHLLIHGWVLLEIVLKQFKIVS